MLGAIIGDIIGSVYEWNNVKTEHFDLFSRYSHFTDDTVLTVAVADAILVKRHDHTADQKLIYAAKLKEYGRKYPDAGYGSSFKQWLTSESMRPYNSFGNGSAMRVSPVGFAFNDLDVVLKEAKLSAEVSHNHREGIRGAQAIAGATFMARKGLSKEEIRSFIQTRYGYNLSFRLDDIRDSYKFDESCQGTVPQAIVAFLESEGYENAICKAISLGGDSDTLACIAGGLAEAYYREIPSAMVSKARLILDYGLKQVIDRFYAALTNISSL